MGWLPPAYFDTLYLTYAFVNTKKCANLRFKLAKKKKKKKIEILIWSKLLEAIVKISKSNIYIYIYTQKKFIVIFNKERGKWKKKKD